MNNKTKKIKKKTTSQKQVSSKPTNVVKTKLVKFIALSAIWSFSILFLIFIYLIYDIPSSDELLRDNPHSVTILDDHSKEIGSFLPRNNLKGNSTYTEIDKIPNHLKLSVLAAEDHRFYEHFGIDIVGLFRALFRNITAGKIKQGGSTITQQLVKISLLSHKKTLKRKVQEFLIAINLENKFTKDHILELYLNRIYLGPGVYGVANASKFYFSKDIRDVSISESAVLAGMIRSPGHLSPSKNEEKSAERAFRVLEKMYEYGFINYQQFDYALNDQVIIDQTIVNRNNFYFTDWVTAMLPEYLEKDIIVKTTLNRNLQNEAQQALQDFIEEYSHLNISQGAIIGVDSKGAVKIMVGGKNYGQSQFNRTLYSKRQSGSVFKIFVYLAALEAGIKRKDMFNDEKLTVKQSGKIWEPRNIDRKYHGYMSMEESFSRSMNIIAIKIAMKVGTKKIVDLAKKLGITTKMHSYPSMALGTADTKLIDLASSYATITNDGKKVVPFAISKIIEDNGKNIYSKTFDSQETILEPYVAFEMQKMLNHTVKYGSARRVRIEGFEDNITGKTGTTQDYRDAYFIGSAGDLTIAVWLGNDDNSPMKKVTGSNIPARIWRKVMEKHLNQ